MQLSASGRLWARCAQCFTPVRNDQPCPKCGMGVAYLMKKTWLEMLMTRVGIIKPGLGPSHG